MKQQRGSLGRLGDLADTVGGAVRRRQQGRESRVVVYDSRGHPRVVPRGSPAHDELLEIAEQLVETVGE